MPAPRRQSTLPERLLENPTRGRIYNYIARHPGTNRRGLQLNVEPSASTIEWHLVKLVQARLIVPTAPDQRSFRTTQPPARSVVNR